MKDNSTSCGDLPRISIVMPVFNAVAFIEAAIQSVVNQNYPNLEFIVIDGGSTDGTVDVIKKYANDITYWESERDRGQTHALNKGFEHASGDLRGWLNSDEEYVPGALLRVGSEYMSDPSLDLIYGSRYFLDLTLTPHLRTVQEVPKLAPRVLILYTGRILFSDATFWTERIHKRVGVLNEFNYPRYAMDVDWFLRVAGKALQWRRIVEPLSVFKFHGANVTAEGDSLGLRLNERIRRNYAEENNISSMMIFFGWLWYSTKLRYFERGLRGFLQPPKWSTVSYLFLKKNSKSS